MPRKFRFRGVWVFGKRGFDAPEGEPAAGRRAVFAFVCEYDAILHGGGGDIKFFCRLRSCRTAFEKIGDFHALFG